MEKTLTFTFRPDSLKIFSPLFQQGVILKTRVGCSIKDFLIGTLGLTPEYLETRIQTLFLDGKAVDNPGKALLHDGAILALSGAMPGLVGATLRCGGTYASLRQAITLSEPERPVSEKDGRVTLKLFNLLVPEIGPVLFAKGFWIKGTDLDKVVASHKEDFWSQWSPVLMDGREVDAQELGKTSWSTAVGESDWIRIAQRAT